MEKEYGIENLWRVLAFVVEAGNVAEAMKTADNWMAKGMALAPLLDEVKGLITLDFKALSDEYKDWSAEEKAELVARASEKYDIKNEVMEKQIEGGLALAIEIADCVGKIIDYRKSLK